MSMATFVPYLSGKKGKRVGKMNQKVTRQVVTPTLELATGSEARWVRFPTYVASRTFDRAGAY